MAGRVFFFLQHATYEPAFQAASMGITAAAMGDEVYFVFAFDALRQLVRGGFGLPHSEKELAESARAEGLGVPRRHACWRRRGRWARSWWPATPR